MTPSQKQQIKHALEKYLVEHNLKWSKYPKTIGSELKLDSKDTRLHDRDPRNWVLDGIEPTEGRLVLYERFIRKVYPDFEFLPDEVSDDIEMGLFIWRQLVYV